MAINKNQSAIREVRDQLFLDTADGGRLNIVTANLGIKRPVFGIGDDKWRALIKRIALKPKLITRVFRHVLEICVGPQYNRRSDLTTASVIGDKILIVGDASKFVQTGTIILDEGQGTEETIDFCIVNKNTNEIFLNNPTIFAHAVHTSASNLLKTDVAALATVLPLNNTFGFPTTGFPYTISVGAGTLLEETVTVTAVNGNSITVSALVNAHSGFKSSFVRRPLEDATFEGRVFLQFDIQDTREFPETGWIRIDNNVQVAASDVLFEDVGTSFTNQTTGFNDATDANWTVFPGGEATGDYAAIGYTFPFFEFSADNTNGTAGVGGIVVWEYWDGSIWSLLPGVVDGTSGFTAAVSDGQIVTWTDPGDWATTTLDGGSSLYYIRARITTVYSTNPIYDQGFVEFGEEIVFFDENDSALDVLFLKTPLLRAHASGVSVELLVPGETVSTASVLQAGIHWDIFDTDPRNLRVFIPSTLELVRLIDASYLHGAVPAAASTTLAVETLATDTQISLVSAAGFPDEAGIILIDGTAIKFYTLRDEDASPDPLLQLTSTVGAIFSIGDSVVLVREEYAGTNLEEGNLRDIAGVVQPNQFSGPYLYELGERAPSITNTTTTSILPSPTKMANDQDVGFTNLEVLDASQWSTAYPYAARIGRLSGFEEDVSVTDRTLAALVNETPETITVDPALGATSLGISDAVPFPETSVSNQAGYRIIIDRGNPNEEIAFVLDNDAATGPGTLTVRPLLIDHSTTETVELLADVLTVTVGLAKPHKSAQVTPTSVGDRVEVLTSSFTVSSTSGFSNSGTAILNFGKERINARSKITTVVSTSVYAFADTSIYPTTDFPYQIVMGQGLFNEELVLVTANDTGLDRLTLTAPAPLTHVVGEYVEFNTGEPEVFTYQDIDGATIIEMIPAQVFDKHTIGERVILSTSESVPDITGFDYPFYLPPDPQICIDLMFELIRAHGVKVTIIDDR